MEEMSGSSFSPFCKAHLADASLSHHAVRFQNSVYLVMSTTRERYIEWKTRSLLPQLPIEVWS